ncbi:hypothetical protein BH721_03885 [Clostridium baratii]|nr:hypothetical protein A1M12_10090 [Clostridium baratii]OPF55854.1 hypothetical protein BH721_03885 [Clostridium baratii]OPF56765.1 hypothetical protein BH724_09540 [Clostridium baratii]OPF59764.1 hypothetical protein BH725_04040 [Clostridium baratii]
MEDLKAKVRVGRPSKYPYEMLKDILLKYASENVGGEITISKLVKYSELPIQAWRFNKKIKEDIARLNQSKIISLNGTINGTLPSADDLVNMNYKNKDRLIKAVSDLIEIYQYAFSENLKFKKALEKNALLLDEIGKLKTENTKLKKERDGYLDEIKKIAVKSQSSIGREEFGIQENLIDLEKYSQTHTTFSELFD